jgi:hypothetical protein
MPLMSHVTSCCGTGLVMGLNVGVRLDVAQGNDLVFWTPNHSIENMHVNRKTTRILENRSSHGTLHMKLVATGKETDIWNRQKPVMCSRQFNRHDDNWQVDHVGCMDSIWNIRNRFSLLRSQIWSHATKLQSSLDVDLFILVHLHPWLWLKEGRTFHCKEIKARKVTTQVFTDSFKFWSSQNAV